MYTYKYTVYFDFPIGFNVVYVISFNPIIPILPIILARLCKVILINAYSVHYYLFTQLYH